MRAWDYQPPKKVNTKEYQRVFRPNGYLLLSEAIDRYGKARIEGWTGDEIKARLDLDDDPAPSGQREIESWIAAKLDPNGFVRKTQDARPQTKNALISLPALEERWTVTTAKSGPTGWVKKVFSGPGSGAKARALWAEEEPKFREYFESRIERYWAEVAAADRWREVFTILRVNLYGERIRGWGLPESGGKMKAIPHEGWSMYDVEIGFHLGDDQSSWDNPNVIQIDDGVEEKNFRAFIKTEEVDRLINNDCVDVGQAEARKVSDEVAPEAHEAAPSRQAKRSADTQKRYRWWYDKSQDLKDPAKYPEPIDLAGAVARAWNEEAGTNVTPETVKRRLNQDHSGWAD